MLALLKKCRIAVYAEVLRPRALALAVTAIGAGQLLAAGCFHLGFPCTFHQATGLPCPGCGLTRSCLALLQGHPMDAFLLHPFGPPLLAAMGLACVAALLPDAPRQRLARFVESMEVRTALAPVLLAALMLVWILRIAHVVPLTPV